LAATASVPDAADNPRHANLGAWATWYASQGIPVFPLRPGRKRPLTEHGLNDATTDVATITLWWQRHPDANIGAATGVVFDCIDVDGPEGAASLDALYPSGWPATIASDRTPRPGGTHLFVPPMGAPVKANLHPSVDTRGAGGYVVLPPSTLVELRDADNQIEQHAGTYAWNGETPTFGRLDVATVQACKPWRRVWEAPAPVATPTAPRAPLAPSQGTTRYGVRVLDAEAATVAAAGPGGRNDALNRAAYKVGQLVPHEVTEADAAAALLDAARACGLPDAEARATLASGLRNGKGNPRRPEERDTSKPLAGLLPSSSTPSVSSPKLGEERRGTAEPITLADAERVFARWLGAEYDLDALRAVLAAAAVERLDGDPLWLLLISGSGNAKTETANALHGVGAVVASTLSGEAALLSGTSKKETAKDATGGLLHQIGPRGILVVKDVTSIISMNRDRRAEVLAALREVHDGGWARPIGSDGGRTLSWAGRIVVVGAVTTAWDQAHAVIASMGDRFVLLRMDSTTGRLAAGRRAIDNTGDETTMRAELAAAAAGVIAGMKPTAPTLTEAETETLLAAADLVTLARTGVEYDYRGNVVDAHAPEMPTRFAKELAQIVRGSVAIGMDRDDALRLAIRCARDSMPPIRLAIVDDVASHPGSTTADVRRRIDRPWSTVDRQLQALHILGVLACEEEEYRDTKTRWRYSLRDGIDPDALRFTRNVPPPLSCSPRRRLRGSTRGFGHFW